MAEIFTRRLHVPNEVVIEKQTAIARAVLREKFLAADIGISGANFLVADSGAVVIVENEGNARLTTSAPKIHIAVAGIEKLIPRAQDLAIFLKLLARSATGQPLSVYTSFLSGPRRPGEIDGPDEFYVVLLDNGRTKLLPDRSKRQSLYCIRCGACLNTAPFTARSAATAFPGSTPAPSARSSPRSSWASPTSLALPFASSLCGACGEVCPVKIDIPKILLELRSDVKKTEAREKQNRLERLAFRAFAWMMTHPRVYAWSRTDGRLRWRPPDDGGWIRTVPADDERRAGARLAQPARPAAAAGQELPRDVEAALMSRENILHKIRTAVGRSAGQPPADPPPVRLRVPVEMEARMASMIARVEALAGKASRTSDPRAARGRR